MYEAEDTAASYRRGRYPDMPLVTST